MRQITDDEQSQTQPQLSITEGARMRIANPAILLLGKTGAGKSTLGNLLLEQPQEDGPFYVSSDMESVTKECVTATMSIDGVKYDIVDTAGIFDTQEITDVILKEIAKAVHKCAYGVKAILFVFEAKRFTAEQKDVLNVIKSVLGKDATNYIIAVFSHATKAQTSDRIVMQKAWNEPVRSFIRSIETRWGISPNPDIFSSDDPIHQARLEEIKALISSMRGVYTTEQLERTRQEHEEIQLRQKKAEEKAKQEYEEKIKGEAKKEAEEMYRNRLKDAEQERVKQEMEAIMKIVEDLRKNQENAEQKYQEMLEKLQKYEEEAKNRHKDYQNEINRLKKQLKNQKDQKISDCFSLDTKVQLSSGKFVEMAELQVGDRVCSNVKNGKLEFSEVYLISHLGYYNFFLKMIKIEFTNSGGQKSQIRTTPTHCIFREDLSIMYAQDVVPGETKILVLNEMNELIPVIVDNLTIETDTGYISFYTRSGTVIANNILCSCYDDCPPSQALMDLAFAPIRWWTKILPSNHRQEELHPYVQVLETAYRTWCNALNIGKWAVYRAWCNTLKIGKWAAYRIWCNALNIGKWVSSFM